MHEERRWFVGIDWGSQEHVVTLCDGDGNKIGQRKYAHGGTGLSDMIAWLLKASGGKSGEIHVAIETPHGPIVEALLERGFNVYSINPKQLDRFRDRFTVAGAKDDGHDSYVLADSLRTDMPLFRKLSVAEPLIVETAEADSLSLGHTHSPAPMFDDDRHEPFFAAERTRTRTKIARGGRKKHLQKGGESGAKLPSPAWREPKK